MSKAVSAWPARLNVLQSLSGLFLALNEIRQTQDPSLQFDFVRRARSCGGCIAAYGSAQMREGFVDAVGLHQITRFHLDPIDERTDEDFYTLMGDESGVFGCMTLLGCEDYCPKDLPLSAQIAFLRRRMVAATG
jgi:fumarate reductase iron-sulfur subunit